MNLHSIVSPYISTINPNQQVIINFSTGNYKTLSDGTKIAVSSAPVYAQAQIQPLTFTDLQQLNGMNITGARRAIYLNGDVESIQRVSQKGGDVITFPDGTVWLTVLVLENWAMIDGWVKIAVTLQNGQ